MAVSRRIAIIGGGISGLTTAYYLTAWGKNEVTVFESGSACGGCIRTTHESGFVVEYGPNGFLNNEPITVQLVNELGLQNEMVYAKDESKTRFVYWNNELQKVPTSPPALILSNFLSWSAKFRIFFELIFPPRRTGSLLETLFDFIARHFGKEVAEKLASPMTIGVFGGDAHKLAVNYAFPKIKRLEKQFKSLLRGAMRMRNPKAQTKLFSFKNGMQTLIDALIRKLEHRIRYSTPVETLISTRNHTWFVNGEEFDYVVLSTPFITWPRLLPGVLNQPTVDELLAFPVAPIATVSLAFDRMLDFRGFGALIARQQGPTMLGFLHPSDIFAGRTPEGKDLITTLWGGVFDPSVLEFSPQQLVELAAKELKMILKQDLPPVVRTWVWYHRPGIPQYNSDAIRTQEYVIKTLEALPNFSVHSNFYGGVAMNDCIRKSRRLAEQIATHLSSS